MVPTPNINGHDKEGKRYTVVVYFAIQTSKVEDQDFALQKVVVPTRIDGYMKRSIAIDDLEQALV